MLPDTELLEYVCDENEKSTVHMTGTPAGQSPVAVARETLARYAGTYEIPGEDGVKRVVVSLSDAGLFLDFDRDRVGVPRADVRHGFPHEAAPRVHFAADGQGTITHLVIRTVESEETAIRKTNEVSR